MNENIFNLTFSSSVNSFCLSLAYFSLHRNFETMQMCYQFVLFKDATCCKIILTFSRLWLTRIYCEGTNMDISVITQVLFILMSLLLHCKSSKWLFLLLLYKYIFFKITGWDELLCEIRYRRFKDSIVSVKNVHVLSYLNKLQGCEILQWVELNFV